MIKHTRKHSHTSSITAVAAAATLAAAAGLVGCSRSGDGTPPPVAAASRPAPVVAAAPATTAVAVAPAPAPDRVVVAQNERHVDTHHRRDERPLPPRADRDTTDPEPMVARHRDEHVAAAACTDCGVVESVDTVKVEGQSNGVGATAGGVGGAVIGSRIAGNHNRTLGGVVGAIGGGLLGNAIEKHERTTSAYDVHVRMSDGSLRTVRQSTAPAIGERVSVGPDGLRARS